MNKGAYWDFLKKLSAPPRLAYAGDDSYNASAFSSINSPVAGGQWILARVQWEGPCDPSEECDLLDPCAHCCADPTWYLDSNGYYKAFLIQGGSDIQDTSDAGAAIQTEVRVKSGKYLVADTVVWCEPIGQTSSSPCADDDGFWLLQPYVAEQQPGILGRYLGTSIWKIGQSKDVEVYAGPPGMEVDQGVSFSAFNYVSDIQPGTFVFCSVFGDNLYLTAPTENQLLCKYVASMAGTPWNINTSQSVQVWNGLPGSETNTGLTITAYNKFQQSIQDGTFVWVGTNGWFPGTLGTTDVNWYAIGSGSGTGLLGKISPGVSWAMGTSQSVEIWGGTPGSETDQGYSVTAWNWLYPNFKSYDMNYPWVWIANNGSGWYLVSVEHYKVTVVTDTRYNLPTHSIQAKYLEVIVPTTGGPISAWTDTSGDTIKNKCCTPCTECNAGTTYEEYQITFGAGVYSNGNCTDCVNIPGSVVIVEKIDTCKWEGTVNLGNCDYTVDLEMTGTGPTLTLIGPGGMGTAYNYALVEAPTYDCTTFTMTPNFGLLDGTPFCGGVPNGDTGGDVTAVGL